MVIQRDDDHLPLDALETQFFLYFVASCSLCDRFFHTFDDDPPVDPMVPWTRRVANLARIAGWRVHDGACVCPACAA